jgi:voltage-gated potassium channel
LKSELSTDVDVRAIEVSGPFRRMITGVVIVLVISTVAVVGYVAAGWGIDDAVYMVVITIFGVGYGEVKPVDSAELRVLTMFLVIFGYASIIYTVGGFIQMLIDGELNKALGARKMTIEIEKLKNHTIICGIGRLGTILAKELRAAGKPFVAIDNDPLRLRALEEQGCLVLNGDASDEATLEQAGIARASTVAAVMSTDATNVFVTITARELNPDVTIFARGENPRTEKKLLGCGADRVILPTAIGAHKFAQLIIRPSAENMLEQLSSGATMVEELRQLGLQINEIEIKPDTPLVDHPVGESETQSERGLLILGVRKADGSTLLDPPPETILQIGDTLILLGHSKDVATVAKKLCTKVVKTNYRGLRI